MMPTGYENGVLIRHRKRENAMPGSFPLAETRKDREMAVLPWGEQLYADGEKSGAFVGVRFDRRTGAHDMPVAVGIVDTRYR